MASGDLIVKVADKDTLDRTYANTNAILAAVGVLYEKSLKEGCF